MFITQSANRAGIYLVRFFLNGQEMPVIIDDFLPVNNSTGKPAFAKCRDGELWVSLLEKAWAKLHGTYARCSGGLPCFAANHIMGVPAESYVHSEVKDPAHFYERIKSADRRSFTMIASTPGEGEVESALGLVSGHAYSLISIHEFHGGYGPPLRLLKLRNPWGSGEWLGDWSDRSPLWTPELKQQVGFVDRDDGIFFMTMEDYMANFERTAICVENNEAKYKHSQLYHTFSDDRSKPG